MGMGDKPKPFAPKYRPPIRDDVIGKEFYYGCVRSCPEPHVIAKYGVGGQANVSIYTCKRCKYHKEYKWFGGVSCEYGMAESIPPTETSELG